MPIEARSIQTLRFVILLMGKLCDNKYVKMKEGTGTEWSAKELKGCETIAAILRHIIEPVFRETKKQEMNGIN